MGDRNHIHHLLNNNLPLISTNIILAILATIPLISFSYFKFSFEITFLIFVSMYCVIIFLFKSKKKNR